MPGLEPKSNLMTSPWSWRVRPDEPVSRTKNKPKINLKKWHVFRGQFKRRQLTTFTTHFTTFLPAKNHTQTPTFLRTPLKKPNKTTQRSLYQPARFFLQTTIFSE